LAPAARKLFHFLCFLFQKNSKLTPLLASGYSLQHLLLGLSPWRTRKLLNNQSDAWFAQAHL
jgi:hypothetical protein